MGCDKDDTDFCLRADMDFGQPDVALYVYVSHIRNLHIS